VRSVWRIARASANRLTEMSGNVGSRDELYLFACHLEWHTRRSLVAYQELLAALDDPDRDIRTVAAVLLHRNSPRPHRIEKEIEDW